MCSFYLIFGKKVTEERTVIWLSNALSGNKMYFMAIYAWFSCLGNSDNARNPTRSWDTVYPKKYAHGFCFAVLCCRYTLTDFPITTRLTSLALWQSNDCPSASKATLMNMDKYFTWIYYERLHNHNKAKHNKTVCIFLGIYCIGILFIVALKFYESLYQSWM